MRILLVGEYSRLHNSLKEGLHKIGHEVTLISLGDGFKKYPADVIVKEYFTKGILKTFKNALYKFTSFDLESFFKYLQVKKFIKNQQNPFDIVQLVNETSFLCSPFFEKKIIKAIEKKSKKMFLLTSGSDYKQMNYFNNNKQIKSIYTPFNEGKIARNEFQDLKYLKKNYKKLHQFIYKKISGVIATDLDYVEAYTDDAKFLGLIPNPVNIDILNQVNSNPNEKIKIFHGINSINYFKKGNDFFDQALQKIQENYAEKVEIIVAKNLPYTEYITLYNTSDILLDQVYAYDQGYNALEAMAKGKVVFTGASTKFYSYYNLENLVAINANPNSQEIFKNLEFLINNPEHIPVIQKQAKKFIHDHHHYIKIAEKYLKIWEN